MGLNRKVLKQIKDLTFGDLVFVSWFDTSIGKKLERGLAGIDVPVSSWGIFIGVLGQKNKHLVLAQNKFHYAHDSSDRAKGLERRAYLDPNINRMLKTTFFRKSSGSLKVTTLKSCQLNRFEFS
jgi:hypothetical protein